MFLLHRPALNSNTGEHYHYQTSYPHGLFGLDFLLTQTVSFDESVFCNQGVFPQWILKYEGLFLSCRCFSPFAGVTVIHFAVTFMTAALNNAIGNLCDDKQHTLAATLHYSSACSFKSYGSIRFRTVKDLQIRPQLYFLSK